MSTKNHRTNPRVTAFIPVMIRTDDGKTHWGEIEDISLGGASVRCPYMLGVGDKVTLELRFAGLKSAFGDVIEVDEIDDGGMVRAEEVAEVRWEREGVCFGIKFVRLSSESRRFLGRLVKFFEKIKAVSEEKI